MKYFSLLSGQEVHAAPGKKVIPESEFSILQEASEILEKVQKEAVEYKKQVAFEAEEMKEVGFNEGFEQALISLNQHLLALDKELKELREHIQKQISPLAIKAVRKILGEELKLHPDRIVDIVLNSLKPVTQHKKILIYVNQEDLNHLETAKPKLKQIFEHLENLSIQQRADIEPGGCVIETEKGIINAQFETQMRSLEIAFESFMKT